MIGMMTTAHDAQVERIRQWIAQLMALTGQTASELARECGLAESTLTRLMSADGPANLPRESTLLKIEQRFQTRRPTAPPSPGDVQEPPLGNATEELKRMARLIEETQAAEAFVVSDHALDLAGYLPEDTVFVDTQRTPQPGDVVAIRFRAAPGRRDAVTLRIFDQPFLTPHTTDEALRRPLLIDPARIEIIGVTVAAMRQRNKK